MRTGATLAALALVGAAAVGAEERRPLGDPVETGRRAFFAQGCYGCHTIGALGTPIGPDLSRLGSKYPRDYLERWLRDPAAQRPRAHMPKLELTEEEIGALAAFLSSLR